MCTAHTLPTLASYPALIELYAHIIFSQKYHVPYLPISLSADDLNLGYPV